MQASETKIRQLIEGTKQYVIPLFQRPYSWNEKQWKTLWSDVKDRSRHDNGRPHFFGSIVTTPAKSVPQGVGKWLLIDGQQRITTIQVFLAAIRDAAIAIGESKLPDRIDGQYLTNAYEEGDERMKVLPSRDDRPAFRAIIRKEPIEHKQNRLSMCYHYFRTQLEGRTVGDLDSLHLAIVDRQSLVVITCDEHDNPHLIFESLNAKGEKLTPADLIRNYLLMRVHVNDQDRHYELYWLPIQQALDFHLTEFVRHYLMKEGKVLKEADVYFELKDRLINKTTHEAQDFLRDLHRHGMFYAKFINPTLETNPAVSERLDRLHRLKLTVAYPFLLRVFDAADTKMLSFEQVLESLDLLESFLIRRAVCKIPTSQLRQMLPPVFDAAGGASEQFLDGLRKQLGGNRCPDDEKFIDALVSQPLYSTAEQNARVRLILERMERSFKHKEPASLLSVQIEHIMPQTLTPEWLQMLGSDPEKQHSQLVHTLGNLTLTMFNADMSNKPYKDKQQSFASSHYVLNTYFADVTQWTPEAIRERGRYLAKLAVQIWPDVGRTPKSAGLERSVSIAPSKVRFRSDIDSVDNWKDAFVKLLKHFDTTVPGLLQKIATERMLEAVVSNDEKRFRRARAKIGDIYVNTHASANQLKEWCRKIAKIANINEVDYDFIIPESYEKTGSS